jgi:hypothetical protein
MGQFSMGLSKACALDVTLVFNAGIVHQGTPLPNFPIFAPGDGLIWVTPPKIV